ncbi:MAG: hypothetical protein ABI999_02135 [Acidobacteriota bacterium]
MDMEKSYPMEIEPLERYFYAFASGDLLTASISAAYWNEIAAKRADLDLRKILIEKDFKEVVTADQMLEMADHLATLLPEHLIAFVDICRRNVYEFGKRVVRDRHRLLQTFEDIETAEAG